MEQLMQQNQQPGGEMASRSKKSMVLVAGAVVVLVLLALWFWYTPATAPEPEAEISGPALSEQDTTAVIEQELEATDLGDIEAEFQSIEEELQNL